MEISVMSLPNEQLPPIAPAPHEAKRAAQDFIAVIEQFIADKPCNSPTSLVQKSFSAVNPIISHWRGRAG